MSMRMLDYSINRALERTDSKGVFIIVDESTSLSDVNKLCESKSDDNRTVRGDTYDSSNSKYKDMQQTHDYVANAAGSATKGFPLRALCMKMRMHRLRKYEKI